MKNGFPIVLGFGTLVFIFINLTILNDINNQPKIDLPEEYSQATSKDTLIAIKQGDTLFVQFNNK